MSKLIIRAQAKSKARLVDKLFKVKHFIVGRQYDINFVVKNIGDKPSPSVNFRYHINWPGTEASTTGNFDVKSLEPEKCHESDTETYIALSTGLATIIANAYTSPPQNKKIEIWSRELERDLGKKEACGTIYATTPEAIYEYWALLIATAGLLVTSVNWKVYRLLWLFAFFLIFIVLRGIWSFSREQGAWFKEKSPYIVMVLSVVIALSFFFHPGLKQKYWSSFFPKFVATMLGVLIGTSLTLLQIKSQSERRARS